MRISDWSSDVCSSDLTIEALGAKGDGLATVDGRPLFLPQTLPGERVLARVTGERGGSFKGEVIELLQSAPHRADPPCPFFGPCGGCALQPLYASAYARSAERRVGKECSSPCRFRWRPYLYKKNIN